MALAKMTTSPLIRSQCILPSVLQTLPEKKEGLEKDKSKWPSPVKGRPSILVGKCLNDLNFIRILAPLVNLD